MSALGALVQIAANPYSGYALPPHWGWYIILYFFCGGLSAGSYFIATLLLLSDPRDRDRDAIRLGYLLSFPLLLVCAFLLIVDLGVPTRFWHMLIQSKHVPTLLLKPWSPISVGSWVLTAFGLFSFVAFVGTLVETGRIRSPRLVRLDRWARGRPRPFAVLWGMVGAFFGFFLAGYTGVLVTATSIPVWHNARLLGALFLASAASTSYALLSLLLLRHGRRHTDPTVAKLARADRFTIGLELVVLAIMLLLLGPVASPIVSGGFGIVFWVGVIGLGLVAPLVLPRSRGRGWDPERRAAAAAMCVLAGGLLLRFVIVMSPQFPAVPLWAL